MSIKDFFWFSLSAALLGIFFVCVYYMWKSELIKKEAVTKSIDEIDANMYKDGFDRAEISEAKYKEGQAAVHEKLELERIEKEMGGQPKK